MIKPDDLKLTPEGRKVIREKVYPFDEAVPLNDDLAELIDDTQTETTQSQLKKVVEWILLKLT